MSDEQVLGLDEAYSVKTPEDNRRLYAKWAATYESSFVDAKQYRYPKAISEVFNERVPADSDEVALQLAMEGSLACNRKVELRPYIR